jgi:hypothetical protein
MKILNLVSKGVSAFAIFIMPIIITIKRYSTESTTMIEVNNGLGLVPTLFIGTIIVVALYFVANQFLEMVRTNKFGWLSIIFFGLILGISLFGVWFVTNSIVVSASQTLDTFVETMTYHRQTVYYMLYPIVFGIGLGVFTKIATLKWGE